MGNLFLVIVLVLIGGTTLYYYQPTLFPHSFRAYIEDAKGIMDPDKEAEETDIPAEEPEENTLLYVDYGYPTTTEITTFKCTSDENCIMHLDNPNLLCNVSVGKCFKLIEN